jgi:hypothetical protein
MPELKIEAQSERNEIVLGKVEHFENRSARESERNDHFMHAGAIAN